MATPAEEHPEITSEATAGPMEKEGTAKGAAAQAGATMGRAGSALKQGAARTLRGAHVAEGRVMGFVDATLTDAIHVTGHVASEAVNTVAHVLGDVVGGVSHIVRRVIAGARPVATGMAARTGLTGSATEADSGTSQAPEEKRP